MTDDILYRSTTLEISEENSDEWIFSGLAVPFNTITKIGDYRESFAPGAFSEVDPDLPIYFQHNHLRGEAPIGMITATEESEAGLRISAKISKTVRGTEIYQLLKDKVLRNFSIGFKPLAHKIIDDVVVRTKASLFEVSVVANPAYAGAVVTEVRQELSARSADEEEEKMTDSTNADLLEIRSGLEDLSREWDSLKSRITEGSKTETLAYRSYGDYIKGFARNEDAAVALFRKWDAEGDWVGGTSADSVIKNSWVGDLTRIVEKPRRVLNAFEHSALPAEGLTVEFAKLEADTTQVAVQTAEGDELAYGKVDITIANAPVKTYGGWTSMTRQEIERANVNIVDTAYRALAAKYAQTTEAAVRTAVTGASAQAIAGATIATYDGWIDYLVDAAMHLDGKGLTVDGVLVSADVFKAAAKMKSGDSYLLDRNQGSVNITGLSGEVLNVPFVLTSGSNIATVFNRSAVKSYESNGVPARLTDQDITTLTNSLSIYGYLAIAVQDPKALVVRGA